MSESPQHPYDAVLLTSFGGPEGPDDVFPFLRNVTRGRGVSEERLADVAEHYLHFGGVSPINAQNRALRAALQAEIDRRGLGLPVYWGNRNWAPYVRDAVAEAERAGHTRLLGLVTSAYTSHSGVGQYREAYEQATAGTTVAIDRVREYFDHPGFVDPLIEGTRAAVDDLVGLGHDPTRIHLLFVTHSIPTRAADASGPAFGPGGAYVTQHRATAAAIHRVAAPDSPWELVYQSRSGDPATPWLEPDITDAITRLDAEGGADALVCIPFGFVSDHMEVVWDLDNEAAETAAQYALPWRRVPTPGVHPAFVAGLVDLLEERLYGTPTAERPHCTPLGPWPDHPRVASGVTDTPSAAARELIVPAVAG